MCFPMTITIISVLLHSTPDRAKKTDWQTNRSLLLLLCPPNKNQFSFASPAQLYVMKVVSVLPVRVDAANDPPTVILPHHHVMKFGALEIWNRYLQTQTGISAATGNLTMGILTETTSGQIVLDGIGTQNVNLQVN